MMAAGTPSTTTSASSSTNNNNNNTQTSNNTLLDAQFLKHKRRLCQVEGCTRIVKSQGRCQRHGAKPKACRVEGCVKQAQGNFDGMCKAHFHQNKQAFATTTTDGGNSVPSTAIATTTLPTAVSVYDTVIPASIRWIPTSGTPFPLVHYLEVHFALGTAWHRNQERVARGIAPVRSAATQLLGWERELVWTEILLLTGHPQTSFRHLARAWGRDKGFHRVLAQFICQRQGSVERKRTHSTGSSETNAKKRPKKSVAAAAAGQEEEEEDDAFPFQEAFGGDAPIEANDDEEEDAAQTAANIWDSACYYGMEYNEALAATLLDCVAEDDSSSTSSSGEEETTKAPAAEQQQTDSSGGDSTSQDA